MTVAAFLTCAEEVLVVDRSSHSPGGPTDGNKVHGQHEQSGKLQTLFCSRGSVKAISVQFSLHNVGRDNGT